MSTKTSIKRVALIAVSALGFGLMSVVPSSATTNIRLDGTPQGYSIRTDASADLEPDLESSAAVADGTDITVTLSRNDVALAATPAGFTIAWTASIADAGGNAAGADSTATANDFTVEADNDVSAADVKLADLTIARTLAPGKYVLSLTQAGGTATSFTFYVSTKPTAFALSATSGTVDAGGTKTFTVGVKDAQGNPTYLLVGEAADLTLTGGVVGATKPTINVPFLDANNVTNSTTGGVGPTVTISAAAGVTAGTYTITVSNAAGLAALANATYTVTAQSAPSAATSLTISSGTYVNADGDGNSTFDATGDLSSDAANRVAFVSTNQKSLTFVAATSATSGYIRFVVAAHGSGLPAGVTATTATDVAIVDNGASASPRYTASLTLTAIAPAAGFGYDVSTAAAGGTVRGWDVTYQAPVANSVTTVDALLEGGSISALTGSTNSFEVVVYDQFGVELPNAAVTFTTSGRNANNKGDVTASAGTVRYSYQDVSTSTTTLADTVTATINGTGGSNGMPSVDNTASMTINFKSSITVATATISGNTSPTALTANSIAYANAITSGTSSVNLKANATALLANNGANVAAIDQAVVKVVLKDSLGNVVPGVRVTFSGSTGVFFAAAGSASLTSTASIVPVSGATAKSTIDVYSDSNGEAFAQARFTKTGTGTVKAIAYGTSSSDLAVLVKNIAADARSISAVTSSITSNASNNPVATFKIVDGYGNTVEGVDVKFTVTGVGTFLNGSNSVTGTSDANGLVTVAVASSSEGQATVTSTVTTSSQASLEQAAETSLGFAAAVKSASATVKFEGASSADAATEAALEATEAANQAYEAAVVATETAEAAVAAAEDAKAAADAATAAVEALATQVSTMMAELKAQVTKLAKTVAKILKRV